MASRRGTKLKLAIVIGCLGILMTLKPTACRAQAEIDPDHYDFIHDEPFAAARNDAATDRSTHSFPGTFTLPFDASYAGLILPRGTYSVDPVTRKGNSVTLVPDGNGFTVQTIPARLRIGSRMGPSAFVLERAGQQTRVDGNSFARAKDNP